MGGLTHATQDAPEHSVEELFEQLHRANLLRTDRLFGWLLIIEWAAVVTWKAMTGLGPQRRRSASS